MLQPTLQWTMSTVLEMKNRFWTVNITIMPTAGAMRQLESSALIRNICTLEPFSFLQIE